MRMLIDSDWVDSSDGTRIEVRNPATGEVIDSVPQASLEDTRRAVDAALRGKDRMARLPAHERAAILFRTAQAMEDDLDALARLLASENGKPLLQTTEEVRV